MQSIIHYFLHFGFPLLIATIFFRSDWKKVYILFLLTMLVDLDHLFANPIFDPQRCSIGFHYLHTLPAIIFYTLLLFLPRIYRIIGIGLLMHMATDLLDCIFIYKYCPSCHFAETFKNFFEFM